MKTFVFQKAQAVWARGRETEKNLELAFRAVLPGGEATLYLAASTLYRLWVNGAFAGAGPARAAHGYYCVDRVELTDRLNREKNVVVIEVLGCNVNTYDTLDQPSFLTAEILRDHQPVLWTGDSHFQAYDLKQRVQRIQRYSFQRAFTECYHLRTENQGFYENADWRGGHTAVTPEACTVFSGKRYLVRQARMPRFEELPAEAVVETGKTDFDYRCPKLAYDSVNHRIGGDIKGYGPGELQENLLKEAQNMAFVPFTSGEEKPGPLRLTDGYGIYRFPFNATGFLRLKVECEEPCRVYLLFDEILRGGKVDFLRLTNLNCFKYTLDPGQHVLMTFAPYTMQYVQVVLKGSGTVRGVELVEYKHPPVSMRVRLPEDEALSAVYKAALETYLANAVDVFTDCPSRERAGWLCDSFFTARVEHVLTGETVLEKAFLENFLLPEGFAHLPEGMLPMCYPADHNDGNFIPNWAMWFVLELEEYLARSGDRELIDRARERVYRLLNYFRPFENEYGLLEHLERWVFVEWSRANDADVVQDVNFPTNMLYMRMLQAVSRLYGDEALAGKAKKLRRVIRERSLRGSFYTDNERRTPEGLENPGNCTEVCQYYAFFTGVATREEDAGLWEILCRDFGYQRKETGLYPEVAFANAFIGNYLRIELLYRDGRFEEVVDNIRGYFTKMARLTGTLWEHDDTYASCNHGFASHVIYWLAGIFGVEKHTI